MQENRQEIIPKRDTSSKKVLGNPVLYAQFLRDNVDIPFLKNIRPEDIEDVSERYIPYLGTEFESDTVKRVRLRSCGMADGDGRKKPGMDAQEPELMREPLFLVST